MVFLLYFCLLCYFFGFKIMNGKLAKKCSDKIRLTLWFLSPVFVPYFFFIIARGVFRAYYSIYCQLIDGEEGK